LYFNISMDTRTNPKLVTSILRFNFTEEIIDIITQFSKIHQFDDRHTYRENWDKFFEENKSILLKEIGRLMESGYDGDIKDKMYKAGRYYFRKKYIKKEDINQQNIHQQNIHQQDEMIDMRSRDMRSRDMQQKRTYISMDKKLIEYMDKHIIDGVNMADIYTPAIGYNEFCKLYEKLLDIEKKRLQLEFNIDDDKIGDKFKKTYKNRYFILTT